MKKTKGKLDLKTIKVRVLQDDKLVKVVGGRPTAACTANPTCG